MQTLTDSTRGLALLVNLNWDRFLVFGALCGSLLFSAWIGAH